MVVYIQESTQLDERRDSTCILSVHSCLVTAADSCCRSSPNVYKLCGVCGVGAPADWSIRTVLPSTARQTQNSRTVAVAPTAALSNIQYSLRHTLWIQQKTDASVTDTVINNI